MTVAILMVGLSASTYAPSGGDLRMIVEPLLLQTHGHKTDKKFERVKSNML